MENARIMSQSIKITKKPKLQHPTFLAAWPGMGNVALTTFKYLRDQLKAELLGEIDHADFFAPTGAAVSKQVIQRPDIPSNQFYYYQSPTGDHDILFFLGSQQPIPHREYEFARDIMRIAKTFAVKRVYTAAAAPSDMNFKATPRVFAAPNKMSMLKQLVHHDVHFMGEGNIAGLNGLLISVASEFGIDGVCLLGEIPFFTAQIEFPRAALMILRVMTKLLDIRIDMADLELYAAEKEKEIEPLAALLGREGERDHSKSDESVIPQQEEKVPRTIRLKIEKLFKQAEYDRSYKSKMRLKEELDKWELFDEYLDRFLDLFKKGQSES